MRIDAYLSENGYTKSRTESKNLILNGSVTVNGKIITKPSFEIGEVEKICISVDRSSVKYVSRGGFKLEFALDSFRIDVSERLAIDIGASSGGFTDCLLKRGAASVIAIDSGRGQLSSDIAENPKVKSIEGYNARFLSADDLPYVPNMCVMDVSFISATLIMPAIYETLAEDADFVCLIKPQFEVGKANVGKGGIVKDTRARELAVSRVIDFAVRLGFKFIGLVESPILGGDGNTEYLAHFIKKRG